MISANASILSNPIEYLKGVGPQRAMILRKELNIDNFRDLLELYPYRHIDKSHISAISEISTATDFILVVGSLGLLQIHGEGKSRRLVTTLRDGSGFLQLVWFQGISWLEKNLHPGFRYRAYGKISMYNGEIQLTHPEIERLDEIKEDTSPLQPIYPSTEKLKSKFLGGRQIAKLTHQLLSLISEKDLPEIIPLDIRNENKLIPRFQAFQNIHFPATALAYQQLCTV